MLDQLSTLDLRSTLMAVGERNLLFPEESPALPHLSFHLVSPHRHLKYTVARTSTMAKLLYALRLSNWSLAQYQELDHSLSAIFRKATRNQRSFPTALLYLPTNLGGLGLKRLSDLVQMEKWSATHRMIRCGGTIQTVVQGIVEDAFAS